MKHYELGYRLLTEKHAYLENMGFADSMLAPNSTESFKNPLPWMCYPLIEFFKERLNGQHTLFEYGSGSSTLFFAQYVSSVCSVEHNSGWYEQINSKLPEKPNVQILFHELNKNYPDAIKFFAPGKKYDIVIIDGRMRVACSRVALDFLSSDGVLILDDSEREKYHAVFDLFVSNGFNQLSFVGMKPGLLQKSKSTIFYRSGTNCLGI